KGMRCTVLGLTPNLAAALRTDRPPLRASRIRSSIASGIGGRPSCFSSSPAPPTPARARSSILARPQSAKTPHHFNHRLAGWCRRVEALLVQEQVNTERVQFGQQADQVLQASAQPINAPSHYHVEFAARSRFAKRIEGRPAIAALRAANAVVLV